MNKEENIPVTMFSVSVVQAASICFGGSSDFFAGYRLLGVGVFFISFVRYIRQVYKIEGTTFSLSFGNFRWTRTVWS